MHQMKSKKRSETKKVEVMPKSGQTSLSQFFSYGTVGGL
jgi:hypothetical protein